MAAPDEREFVTRRRGQVRDEVILAHYRNELRLLTNPVTGLAFAEDEIKRATQPGSRHYIEADSVDLVGMGHQQRAMWLADQVDPRRSSSRILDDLHGRLWLGEGSRLPAAPSSGDALATGAAGASFVGSPVLGSASAAVAVDGNGVRYQVLETKAIATGQSSVRLAIKALSGGFATNLPVGTQLTWVANKPATADPVAQVVEPTGYPGVGLSGGYDGETSAEYAQRVVDTIGDKAGAGNAPQVDGWARAANSAVEQAFVYPCALNAGSFVVVPTQRRDQNALAGPSGRLPSAGLISDLTAQLVPPASPVVPERAFALVVGPRSEPVDLVLRIKMNQGTGGGWADPTPWPSPLAATPESDTEVVAITTVTSQIDFQVNSSFGFPGGVSSLSGTDAPQLMVWVKSSSRFEKLDVASVSNLGGGLFRVQLNAAPGHALVVGDRISPYTDRAEEIAVALEQHFDLLGPGELVGKSDPRWSRAARRPFEAVRYPTKVGNSIATVVVDALRGVASDVTMPRVSKTETTVAGDISEGPNMLTLGEVTVYPSAEA